MLVKNGKIHKHMHRDLFDLFNGKHLLPFSRKLNQMKYLLKFFFVKRPHI